MAGGNGIFGKWQPVYAEAGLAAFPVDPIAKKPMVSNYMKVGVRACDRFAKRFGNAPALGVACARSRLTIVDVDTTDERVLADALSEYGPTPIIVRSGSGHFQAWYRNGGEPRKIRPDDRPIDILGGGFVVAPPSQGAKGAYEFLEGSLADLSLLPLMRKLAMAPANELAAPPLAEPETGTEAAEVGKRNDTLFREAMRAARRCDSLEGVLAHVATVNAGYEPPLPHDEAVAVAHKAWGYEAAGNNQFGGEMVVGLPVSKFDRLGSDPFAVTLYMTLRRHWRDGETFSAANAMAETMSFPLRKFVDARRTLERHGLIVMIRKPIKGVGPAVYRFG